MPVEHATYLERVTLAMPEAVAAGDVIPFPLFPLGEWKSAKYPRLSLTRDLADELIANFEAGVLGTEPVLDSSGRHDTAEPAAGWYKRLYVAPTKDGGEMLFGDVALTALGAEQLNGGLYRYGSIEIGPVIDNASGAKTDNVFRSATLTNTPVLRMMPPVLDAADVIAASEAVEVALAEISAVPPADDGDPAAPGSGCSDDRSLQAKADEGPAATLREDDAAMKGSDPMKTLIAVLKLAEDADEAAVRAAVVKLTDERDAERTRADDAEAKLADLAKAKRDAEVEARLAELIDGGNLLPAERESWAKLAEDAPASFDLLTEQAKARKVVDLDEHGTSGQGKPGDAYADASVELAARAKARAAKDGLSYDTAMSLELAENSDGIRERYAAFRMHADKEA